MRRLIPSLSSFVVLANFLLIPWVFAAEVLPEGYQAVSGSSSYQVSPDGRTGTLSAQDSVTIGQWQGGFDVAQGHTFKALLPSDGAHLSRDISQDPSQIFGNMEIPQGRFFLVNTNGIYFAPGSSVNAAGLVASSLQISNQDFLNGQYRFWQEDTAKSVRNAGNLSAGKGGITLLGGSVENSGLIRVKEGNIILAAGKVTTLSLDPEGLLLALVKEETFQHTDAKDAVKNSGLLRAQDGSVYLTAEAAKDVFQNLVNQEGVIEATSVLRDKSGRIELVSNKSAGVVSHSGQISAPGGSVKILGEKVGILNKGAIDASGSDAGEILIGGNFQGKGPERNTDYAYIGKDTKINASGQKEGGRIIVWSDKATRIYGEIKATGVLKGGFVETSGKKYLDIQKAPILGLGGIWLLDPRNITITNTTSGTFQAGGMFTPNGDNATVNALSINSALNGGANVIVSTNNASGLQEGNIMVAAAISKTSGPDVALTLTAANNIIVLPDSTNPNYAMISSTPSSTSTVGRLKVSLIADDDVNGTGNILIQGPISTNGGDFDASGINFENPGGTLFMNGGAVNIRAGAILLGSSIWLAGTTVMTGETFVSDDISLMTKTGANITFNGNVSLGASVWLNAKTGTIAINGDLFGETSNIRLTGDEVNWSGFITSLGALVIEPFSRTVGVTIGGAANNTAALDVTQTELSNLGEGFFALAIGNSTGAGGINIISPTTFYDPTGLLSPFGGVIAINAQLNGEDDARIVFSGRTNLNSNIVTNGNRLDFTNTVRLLRDLSIVTNNDGALGGNINFQGTVTGTVSGQDDLTLAAGRGNITFNRPVGFDPANSTGARLGRISIQSAYNTTARNSVYAASVFQSAGSGATTFIGALNTSGVQGIDLNGRSFTFNAPVTTTAAGPLSVTNSGILTIAASADMNLDGAFLQDGTAAVRTAGDIRTTNDNITFSAPVTLTGDLILSTNTGAGNIVFNNTVNGITSGQEDLTLMAGTGSVTFNGFVGLNPTNNIGVRIGRLVIQNALNVTANSGITASVMTQQEGTGLSRFVGVLRTNVLPGINLTGNNFSLAGAVATVGQIVINYRGTVTQTGTYSPAPILRRR